MAWLLRIFHKLEIVDITNAAGRAFIEHHHSNDMAPSIQLHVRALDEFEFIPSICIRDADRLAKRFTLNLQNKSMRSMKLNLSPWLFCLVLFCNISVLRGG